MPHLCYCHTPVRYAYEQFDALLPARDGRALRGLKAAAIARLRAWDRATAARPTRYLANSSAVAERIRRHYGRDGAPSVHPPVDVEFFRPAETRPAARGDFLLCVGALVPYKRFDLAIEAARAARPAPRARRPRARGRPGSRRSRAGSPSNSAATARAEELRELYRDVRRSSCSPARRTSASAPSRRWPAARRSSRSGAAACGTSSGTARTASLYERTAPDALADAVRRAGAAGFDYTRLRASALPVPAGALRRRSSAAPSRELSR